MDVVPLELYVDAVERASTTGYCLPDAALAQVRTALRGAAPVFAALTAELDGGSPARANGHLVVYTEDLVAYVTFTRMPARGPFPEDDEALGVFTIEVAARSALSALSLLYATAPARAYPDSLSGLSGNARLVLTYTGFGNEVVIPTGGAHDVDALYASLLEDLR
ncbi:hypothetical protein ACTHAM_002067 [Cellulomonas soli]|uniref:hypothetical protein n=1 Tax=Cellulomonas soli TaxID=931535 RepID=UPI003F841D7E